MSKVETVVPAEQPDGVIEAIVAAAHTGRAGDGKIFVTALRRTPLRSAAGCRGWTGHDEAAAVAAARHGRPRH